MRFVLGPIPESRPWDTEQERWTPLRQLGIDAYTTLCIVLAAPICAAAYLYLDDIKPIIRSTPFMTMALLVCLLAMLPVHEMFHVMVFRRWWKDPSVMLGFWPSKGMWVCYDSPQPRNRLLVMSLTPLFGLSLLPLGVLSILPTRPWTLFFDFICLLHIAACTGDLQTFCQVYRQVPTNAIIQNKGWQTYWRVPPKP